jgi:hypothetical protein
MPEKMYGEICTGRSSFPCIRNTDTGSEQNNISLRVAGTWKGARHPSRTSPRGLPSFSPMTACERYAFSEKISGRRINSAAHGIRFACPAFEADRAVGKIIYQCPALLPILC